MSGRSRSGARHNGLIRHDARSPLEIPNAELDEAIQTHDAEATINALAELHDVAYQRRRKTAADGLGIRVSELDKLVKQRRAQAAPAPLFLHWNVEPWDEPVDGRMLLQAITERIRSHVVMTADQATTVALWIMMTWVHEKAAVHSPILLITSAEANSGKTTLLGLVNYLARSTLMSVGISSGVLYRSVEKWLPTLIVDEADDVFVQNESLRAIFNSGWTRGLGVLRCEGDDHEPRLFTTFCPKAIGLKGRKLPDTTLSRSIIIEVKRRRDDEVCKDFEHIDDDDLGKLRRQCARWAIDNAAALAVALPEIPEGFHNRVRANWKLMLAIAEQAGCKEEAKTAAAVIENVRTTFEPSVGAQLLTDTQTIFTECHCIRSVDLVAKLVADPDKPWAEFNRGKPISQRQLARLLKGFSIFPKTVHPPGVPHGKGYDVEQFSDAFARYLTPLLVITTFDPCKGANGLESNTYDGNSSVRSDPPHGSKIDVKSLNQHDLHVCTDRFPLPRQKECGGPVCAQCAGKHDGTEHPFTINDHIVWLHRECKPFYPEGDGWGCR
jgi:putative DNA primase/helicase